MTRARPFALDTTLQMAVCMHPSLGRGAGSDFETSRLLDLIGVGFLALW